MQPAPSADAPLYLARADVAILSREDLGDAPDAVNAYIRAARALVVTDGPGGATLYRRGEVYHAPAPAVEEVDPTGAGDVLAAAFFCWLWRYPGRWRRGLRFAVEIATRSVTRSGAAAIPRPAEISAAEEAAIAG